MTPVGQLIWRNRHRLGEGEGLLLIAPPADELPARLAAGGHVPEALCLSYGTHARLGAAGLPSQFAVTLPEAAHHRRIVLFQPREKALLGMLLDLCRSLLDADGELWLAGENRAGIKSAGRRLEEYFARSGKLDSARHCVLFAARGPAADPPFSLERHLVNWEYQVAGKAITVRSLPGVFAHGRLDAGTRLLLESLTGVNARVRPGGRVLDFACGSGAIGLALTAVCPDVDLTLLDDSALALESARRSLAANGLTARLVPSDGLAALAEGDQPPFDWIVSNPPFHSGVRQELETARRFLLGCPRLLAPGGRLCLVANAHLPYGRWLPELFRTVQVIAADRGYNVWLASSAPT